MAGRRLICQKCGGGGVICSAVNDTTMRCPEPKYDDEHDLLGVCQHLNPCPECNVTEYERHIKAIEEAAFALQRLSSAYSGPIGTVLYNIATDVGDRMRKAKREIKDVYSAAQHDYLKPHGAE